jgi:hypothetical protein
VSAPDIRVGDFVRAYAGSGARLGDHALQRNLVIQVLAIGDPPGQPDTVYVSGRIARADLQLPQQVQHTAVYLTGAERSILNLTGQWQLLRRELSEVSTSS